jgi:hypothetical protein
MLLGSFGELLAPTYRICDFFGFSLEVFDGLSDCFRPLIRPQVSFAFALQDIAIELLKHLL